MTGADALVASLSINAALALLFCTVFSILRPWCPAVYSPRASCDLPPPPLPRGIVAWLKPLLALEESSVFSTAGLDAVMYLRFVRMGFQLFAAATFVGCGGLAPLVLSAERPAPSEPNTNSTWLDQLSVSELPNASTVLWGHVAFIYFFTALGLALLHRNYQGFAVLRWQALSCGAPYRYWVLVREIPEEYVDAERMFHFFRAMYPDSLAHVTMARDTSRLDPVFESRQKVLARLEVALCKKRKTGERPEERHLTSPGCWGAAESVGLGSVFGAKVDSIEWQETHLQRLNQRVFASVQHALAADTYPPRTAASDDSTVGRELAAAAAAAAAASADGSAPQGVEMVADGVESAAEGMVEVVVGGAAGAVVGGTQGVVAGAVGGGSLGGVAGALGGALQGGAVGGLTGALHGVTAGRPDSSSHVPQGGETVAVGTLPCAFVGFSHMRSAIHASRVQHVEDATTFRISPCPEPRDVIWKVCKCVTVLVCLCVRSCACVCASRCPCLCLCPCASRAACILAASVQSRGHLSTLCCASSHASLLALPHPFLATPLSEPLLSLSPVHISRTHPLPHTRARMFVCVCVCVRALSPSVCARALSLNKHPESRGFGPQPPGAADSRLCGSVLAHILLDDPGRVRGFAQV